MRLSGVVERLEWVVAMTGSPDAGRADLKAALQATMEVQSYVAARRAELVRALGEHPTAFPEAAIAETSGCTLGAFLKRKAIELDASDGEQRLERQRQATDCAHGPTKMACGT